MKAIDFLLRLDKHPRTHKYMFTLESAREKRIIIRQSAYSFKTCGSAMQAAWDDMKCYAHQRGAGLGVVVIRPLPRVSGTVTLRVSPVTVDNSAGVKELGAFNEASDKLEQAGRLLRGALAQLDVFVNANQITDAELMLDIAESAINRAYAAIDALER